MSEHLHSVASSLASSVTASSRDRGWTGLEVMTARIPGGAGLEFEGLRTHTLAINRGRPFRLEGRIGGRVANGAMTTGAMKLVEAGPRSTWRWDDEPIEMLHVSLAHDALRRYAGELEAIRAPDVRSRVGFHDAELARIGSALIAEMNATAGASLVADALRIELVLRLLDAHSSLTGRHAIRLPGTRLGTRTVRLLAAYIDDNLAGDIRIDDLAALAGMSRFHFARVFRATVGVPPHRYVLARRLERAHELLRGRTLALRDVASLTGFADQSHLTRQLKRRYGLTPGALRAS